MKPEALRRLLDEVSQGAVSVDDAERSLTNLPFEDLGCATIDHHRELRTGYPEIIYGSGKSTEEIATIVTSMAERGQTTLVTRLDPGRAQNVIELFSEKDR